MITGACAQATEPGFNAADAGANGATDAGKPDREVNCSDGVDDDGDGARDCADSDCAGVSPCVPETNCDDNVDNNANGLTDCRDPSCDGAAGCEYGNERSCDDGSDNDGDGNTDCADPDCADGAQCTPETNCANGVDDEGDGNADCADVDCDGVGVCEFGTETSCGDGQDNDGDGAADCADDDCTVLAACAITCPPGTTAASAVASGLPMMIPDFGNAQSNAAMTAPGSIVSTLVRVDVPHEFSADLRLVLVAPDDTRIQLSAGNGGFGAGFVDTWFDDTATAAVATGTPPYTGRFRPDQPLSRLSGHSAAGNWRLEVADQAPFWTGSLESFVVYTCSCDCSDASCDQPWCQPESDCADGNDNDADGDTDCDDSDCAGTATCMTESDCTDGMDNDGDGLTDCADPGCAAACESVETTCTDGVDNDGNGDVDCADAACAFACSLPACPAGHVGYQVSATGLPIALADVATTTTSVNLNKSGAVSRVAVRLSLSHTYDSDLAISLRSPGGGAVDLSSDNGDSGDDYLNTVFIDGAGIAITAGSPPFTGSFEPEQPLSGLNGQAIAGQWDLDITDQASADTGTLSSFELAICAAP